MALASQDFFRLLQSQFYAPVPFPISQSMEGAVEAFFRFLKEPEEIKSYMDYKISPLHRRGDLGYKRRFEATSPYDDTKEFFHFHPLLFKKYDDFIQEHSVVRDFMEKAKPIWDLAYQTIDQLFRTLDTCFPGCHGKIFDADPTLWETEPVHILLRFLSYDWQQSGRYLAKPHFDSGSFTLAISESNPGLRIGSGPENLKLVEHSENQALFFVSSNFRKIVDSDKFHPAWHDVIQMDETKIGKPCARWAVVAFIEGLGMEALPREETHKWYRSPA